MYVLVEEPVSSSVCHLLAIVNLQNKFPMTQETIDRTSVEELLE